MTTDELGKIVADLAKNVDKLVAATERQFTATNDEFRKIANVTAEQFTATNAEFEKLARVTAEQFAATNAEIEKLARATAQEFAVVHDELGTATRAIEGVDLHLSSYASRWTEDFAKLHDWLQELDNRVKFLEKTKK